MAFRIHDSVVRGEIDNRAKGVVRGRIWLAGREDPVSLQLQGNAWPDLAGCLLTFVNPLGRLPHPHLDSLQSLQCGSVGDLTASRKVRACAVPMAEAAAMFRRGEPPPERLANCLYLEWFSEANGRVVIESTDYELTVSTPEWRLTPAEEEERARQAEAALRRFLARLDAAIDQRSAGQKEAGAEWDEHDYEQFLKECDARTDKFMELLDKFGESQEAMEQIAEEMGWDSPDGEADDGSLSIEEIDAICGGDASAPPPKPDPSREGIDWIRTPNGDLRHPLQNRCSECAIKFWRQASQLGLDQVGDDDWVRFLSEFQTTAAKLAGALSSIARGCAVHDPAFVVAYLKRALNHLHESLAGLEAAARKQLLPETMTAEARRDLLDIRTGILQLMEDYRHR